MTNTNTATRITAQVAVEAIINSEGYGYETSTMQAVREVAIREGVANFYLDPLRILISERG
jgi:hypothetical protein